MARKRRHRSPQRDHISIANPSIVDRKLLRVRSALDDLRDLERLTDIADRREYHPLKDFRPSLSLSGAAADVNVNERSPRGGRFSMPALKYAFVTPHKVAVCSRRQVRREVLFAKRRTRKGAGGSRRRNFWSDVKC